MVYMRDITPEWLATALPARAVHCLINAGYDSPDKILNDDPKSVLKRLWEVPNFGRKTEASVKGFLGLNSDDCVTITRATDTELIYELRRRGYIISRPL